MEIFNLKDELSINKDVSLVVTDLKQGVKNPDRVNVFVDEKFAFSLDVSQVVDYKLKIGRRLSEAEYEELQRASEFGKLYQRTLEWVLMRPRSIRETRDYLQRKLKISSSGHSSRPSSRGSSLRPRSNCGCPSEDIFKFSHEIITRLVSKGYLDDRKFARYYVENRFVKKGISRKRMRMELMKKGIARDIIDEVLGARNDEEEILKMIAKKRSRYTDDKLIQYLCRQGFSYELVQNLVQTYGKD